MKEMSIKLTKEQEQKIRELLSLEGQQDPFRRLAILACQFGDLAKVIEYGVGVYKQNLKTDPVYRAEFKIALADMLAQIIVLAKINQIDLDELLNLGINRLLEWRNKQNKQ